MNKTISRFIDFDKKYCFVPGVLIAFILLSNAYFSTYSIVFAAAAFVGMFFYLGNDVFKNKNFYFIFFPLLIVAFCGFISSLFINSALSNQDYFRDIFYLIQNLFFLLSGYMIAIKKWEKRNILYFYILVCALLIVLYNFASVLLSRDFRFDIIRTYTLRGMETILVSCFICFSRLLSKNFKNKKTLIFYILCLCFCLAGFIFSFSRTGFILLIAFLIIFLIKTENFTATVIGVCVVFTLLALFVVSVFFIEIPLLSYYCKKIATSFKEINIFNDWSIGANRTNYWRGYEAYSALEDFKSGNLATMLFGKGFGHNIKLQYAQPLGSKMYSELPIIHNAYICIMVKYGLVGLLCFLVAFITPIIMLFKKRDDDMTKSISESILVYLIVSPLFVTSLLSSCTYGAILFMFGFMISLTEQQDEKIVKKSEKKSLIWKTIRKFRNSK